MQDVLVIIAMVVLAYLMGSFPAGFLLGRLWGVNVLEWGSGRTGGTNVLRSAGVLPALITGAIDVGKGALAVWVAGQVAPEAHQAITEILAGVAVILGHNYSVFVNFSGGKGVGTTSGAFLAMAPVAVGICFFVWLLMLVTFRIVSLSSMIAATLLPISIVLSNRYLGGNTHSWVLYLSILAALLVIYKHRSNINRLFKGTESKIF